MFQVVDNLQSVFHEMENLMGGDNNYVKRYF